MEKKYTIVYASETWELEKEVEIMLNKGYQLAGGVAVNTVLRKYGSGYCQNETMYFQAMTKLN